MGKRRNTEFWDSAVRNKIAFFEYLDRLTELSTCMFDWQNLPDGCDVRFLERTLFFEGRAVFFRDEDLDEYLSLRVAPSSGFNVYGIPSVRRAFGYNGYTYDGLTDKNSVMIYNNELHTNSVRMCRVYAIRLAELDRIIETNCKAQKTPILVQATEKQRLTMKNLYMQYEGNEPFIFGDKEITPDALKAFRTDAPLVADKLYLLKTQYWNEALTYLGIVNTSYVKRERMVADEVMRSMGGTIASRYGRLLERQRAAEKINKLFGLNIEVKFRDTMEEVSDTEINEELIEDREVDDNE